MDSSFFTFAGLAALLVLSPGATWAVVTDGAIDGGRRGGLWTVAGIGTANFLLATSSAFGLAALFQRVPGVLHVLAACGALYMAWLGVRAIRRAVNDPRATQNAKRRADDNPGATQNVKRRADDDPRATQNAKRRADDSPGATQDVKRRADHGPGVTQDVERGRVTQNAPAHRPVRRFSRGLLTNLTNVSVVLFYTVVVPQFITPQDSFLGRYLLLGNTHVAMSIGWMAAIAVFVGTLSDHMVRPAVRRTMDAITGCVLLAFAAKIAL